MIRASPTWPGRAKTRFVKAESQAELVLSVLVPVAKSAVLVLGFLVFALSAWGAARPEKLMKLVTSALDRRWGMILGVIVRLVLGATLIIAAPASGFPIAFTVLGWVSILAAIGLVIMGTDTTRKLIAWFEQLRMPLLRLWLVVGMAFGAFLVVGSW